MVKNKSNKMESQKSDCSQEDAGYVLYRERWVVIGAVAALNITNAILWLSYAPIANLSSKYYHVSENGINWFSFVFPISTVVTGLISVRLADKNGLRFSVLLGAALSGLGAAIRLTESFVQNYPMALVGQIMAALAQPLIICIPTKIAETWFPDRQRLLATSFIVMASLLGQLIGSGITPSIVDGQSCGISCMNRLWTVPGLIIAVLVMITVRNSKPATPPSGSASISIDYPYIQVMIKLVTSWNFVSLMLATGSILGVSDVLLASMEQILCARGFENSFAGYCSMSLLGCGLIGALLTSILGRKKIKLDLAMKILIPMMSLSLCAFVMTSRYDFKYLVIASAGLIGFFGYAAFPVGLELSAEYCFQFIPEATSTGFLIICGHIQGFLYLLLREYAGKNLDASEMKKEVCTHFKMLSRSHNIQPQDDTVPLLIIVGIVIFFGLVFQVLFRPKLRRSEADKSLIVSGITDTQDELDGMRRKNAWEASLIYS